MKELRLKTPKDIEDLLTGCAFYGTGGGGDVAIGRQSLNSCLEAGLDIVLKDPDEMKDDEIEIPVQINGKTKAVISISAEASKDEAIAAGKEAIADKLTGNVIKEIYVPKKIINIVMK